jgi:hypothetical protein
LIADTEQWVVLLRPRQVTSAAPNLRAVNEVTTVQRAELIGHLRDRWPG